ncbi:MAG: hypothetical protein LH632_22045, partial [Rhodoferax sp.]|nr:hypothetical protein [Rhodoferax sp.]
LQQRRLDLRALERPSPFAFPLMVERFRESLSSEKLADRIARMVAELERAADGGTASTPAPLRRRRPPAAQRAVAVQLPSPLSGQVEASPPTTSPTPAPDGADGICIRRRRPRHGF